MVDLEPVVKFIDNLKDILNMANSVTNREDSTIREAVYRLSLGYNKGFGRYSTGQFTLSSPSSKNFNITHNLGSVPKFIAIWTEQKIKPDSSSQHCAGMLAFAIPFMYPSMTTTTVKANGLNYSLMAAFASSGSDSFSWQNITSESIINNFSQNTNDIRFSAISRSESAGYVPGVTYKWIVVDW